MEMRMMIRMLIVLEMVLTLWMLRLIVWEVEWSGRIGEVNSVRMLKYMKTMVAL
jgi:hypothetical protein